MTDTEFGLILAAFALFLVMLALAPIMLTMWHYRSDRFPVLYRRLSNAWHNIFIHPVAGVLWLCGCEKWGDWVHNH